MNEPRQHSEGLRRRVVISFFLGLLLMAGIAMGIGWACDGWAQIRIGWLNPAFGSVLTVSGLALVGWSVRSQYIVGRGTPVPQVATQRLVTQGPYAYTRNPMTLGALVLYLGVGVWMGSGVVIALIMLVFGALLAYISVHETAELAGRFGNVYIEYKDRTPFLWPHFRWRV